MIGIVPLASRSWCHFGPEAAVFFGAIGYAVMWLMMQGWRGTDGEDR